MPYVGRRGGVNFGPGRLEEKTFLVEETGNATTTGVRVDRPGREGTSSRGGEIGRANLPAAHLPAAHLRVRASRRHAATATATATACHPETPASRRCGSLARHSAWTMGGITPFYKSVVEKFFVCLFFSGRNFSSRPKTVPKSASTSQRPGLHDVVSLCDAAVGDAHALRSVLRAGERHARRGSRKGKSCEAESTSEAK